MTPNTHTPTPWYRLSGNLISNTTVSNYGTQDNQVVQSGVLSDANAKHIIHCVNTHDQLVEALKMCRQRFANRLLNLEMNGLALPFEITELKQVLSQITQALAAAEKGA